MNEFQKAAVKDRLEGWELIEFLQIDIADVLDWLLDEEYINDDNIEDVLEFVDVTS